MNTSAMIRHISTRMAADQVPPGDPNRGVANNVRTIIGVSVFSIFLATSSVAARLIFRRTSKLPWMLDDYAIILAALISNANAAAYLWALRYGFGKHIYVLDPLTLVSFFKTVFAIFILYGASMTCVKLSVLSFYGRIFPRNNFRTRLLLLVVFSIIWWILITLVSVFECIPVQKQWNAQIPGKCIPYLQLFIAIQVLNIVLNTAILALPISAITKLQMSRLNKISVAATFGLGGLSIVFGIIRLAILVEDMHQTDITFATPTATWSLIEPSFEIFCACLPCMTPLLKAGRKVIKTSSSFRSGGWAQQTTRKPTGKPKTGGSSGNGDYIELG
ncbi:hypothetical protein GGR56DRAFT_522241 [Xylariaceae sp. FL0804]|nr:hypothetical protein GGR56DRAFT_522241 [Xylariaceae sp. FL0804]